MATREELRIDLKQAIDNGDGTITARRYPLTIWPKRDGMFVKTQIDNIQIAPNNSVVEIVERSSRGSESKFSTFAGGVLPRSVATESEPIQLFLYNLSRDSGVTLILTLVSWRYNEPTGL